MTAASPNQTHALLTVAEAAERLRVSVRTLEREILAGRIAIIRIRSRRLVELAEIERYIAAQRACRSEGGETAGKSASAWAAACALSERFRQAPRAPTPSSSKPRSAGRRSTLRLVARGDI